MEIVGQRPVTRRRDLVARTLIWLAVIALWASLKKPDGQGALAVRSGVPLFLGAGFIAGGIALYAWSAIMLADTAPATMSQPRALLSRGPYSYVRNPLYLSIAAILIGISMLYGAWTAGHLARAALLAVAAHLVVVLIEEPATRKRLGAEYDEYCRAVPRWFPRKK